MSPFIPSPLLYKELTGLHYSRRSLLHNPLYLAPPVAATTPPTANPVDPTEPYSGTNGFDANVVMVLAVLLCALICSLGLNSIIKCAIRCSSLGSESNNNESAQLANKGIKKKALKTFAVVSYSPELKLPGLDTECVICLTEFSPGEKVRILPKCQHGFHVKCIDKWLNSHSSCPTCRHCLIETCQKIVGCDQAGSSRPEPQPQSRPQIQLQQPQMQTPQPQAQTQAPQETTVYIGPLEREDIYKCYREQ